MTVSDQRGRPIGVPGLAAWLRRVAPSRARGGVAIALVSDARMRALNRMYRGKDYATDVLSFANTRNPESMISPRSVIDNPRSARHLGDIVIARAVAARQAREAGHDWRTELRVLALHGLLHLIGYDHERDNGEMHRVENRLRRKGGLREGLIARSRP